MDGIVDVRFWTEVLVVASLVVIFSVQYYEHWHSRMPNGVVLFYWLFFTLAYAVKLRSLIARKEYRDRLPYFATFTSALALAVFEFALEYIIPKKKSPYEVLGAQDECPYEYADVFSVLTFSWMTPMMKFGNEHYITQDDLFNLRRRDTTAATGDKLTECWESQRKKANPSLWLAMTLSFYGPYARAVAIKFVSDVLIFVQPQLLRLLIRWVDSYRSDSPQPAIRGIAVSLLMFVAAVVQTTCLHQYFQRAFDTGMRLRSSLTAIIYEKAMRLSSEGRSTTTTGDIVNLMAVDQQRISMLAQFAIQAVSAPFQVTLCMVSLYQLVGPSMFAGVVMMILMIPVNTLIAQLIKKLQVTQMENKDERTRLMTEILNNIKSIKLYAWSTAFMNKLSYVRNDLELNTLRKIGATQSLMSFVWSTTPFFVSCSTFALFVMIDERPLTTELVFPALTLFNLLSFPLAVLPMVITSMVSASVAVKRIRSYLLADELDKDAVSRPPAATRVGDESVRIRDASFSWTRAMSNVLSNINYSARKGELSCVVGRVGAGKSSLLQALLGDLHKRCGEVAVRGHVAYVAQDPWIMNATVRDNITFGHRWDSRFYDLTIEACALTDDLKTLPDSDQTEVGERGIALSGGQKARLTLARAVYARADVYLLDDCLSAVDSHVGRHIIDRVLGRGGILNGKTRILATNSIPVLKEADFIALLRNGAIIEKGTFQQLMAMKGEIANLVSTATNEDDDGAMTESVVSPSSMDEEESEEEEAQENITPLGPMAGLARRPSTHTLRRASTSSLPGTRTTKIGDEEDGIVRKSGQTAEKMEQGKVRWSVYGQYAQASSLGAVAVYFCALLAAQGMQVAGNFWLKRWSEANESAGGNARVGTFIGVYFGFGIGAAVLVIVQTLVLWLLCSIEASRKLHERMAHALFRAPMSFFETTPTGRILNRFSNDVYRIDELLARTFNMLFNNAGRAVATVGVILAGTPGFAIMVIPLALVYIGYQKYYLRTSRELKRLDSVSRSPIFAHFQESLGGLSTIRAYGQQKRFVHENEVRNDANLRAFFPSLCVNRWLAMRLELIGAVVILCAAALAVVSVASGSGLSAGMVGLAMSYALQVTGALNWIVRQTVEVETNIVSVERVLEYAALPAEAPEVIFRRRPPLGWPKQGGIAFEGYSTRYREGLDLVLRDVNLNIKPHEKIGVVGRTGAGKSSLTLALFRLVEAVNGKIAYVFVL